MASDLELLQIEIETLYRLDDRRRLIAPHGPAPYVVLAVARDGLCEMFGANVPPDLASLLQDEIAGHPTVTAPDSQPAVLDRLQELLSPAVGATTLASGPSYLVPPGTSFPSSVDMLRSTDGDIGRVRHQDLERLNWTPDEWRELLDDALGPWAMALVGDRVVSICHSARLAARGAEAGVWTDPDFRAQGYAASVTAAWAQLLQDTGHVLFYSTSAENRSSQRVAERLGLRNIGWLWSIRKANS